MYVFVSVALKLAAASHLMCINSKHRSQPFDLQMSIELKKNTTINGASLSKYVSYQFFFSIYLKYVCVSGCVDKRDEIN